MSKLTELSPIEIIAKSDLRLSVWAFDRLNPPNLYAGESAHIVGYWVASSNPLYQVRTNRLRENGEPVEFCCHRSQLVECGALEAIAS